MIVHGISLVQFWSNFYGNNEIDISDNFSNIIYCDGSSIFIDPADRAVDFSFKAKLGRCQFDGKYYADLQYWLLSYILSVYCYNIGFSVVKHRYGRPNLTFTFYRYFLDKALCK